MGRRGRDRPICRRTSSSSAGTFATLPSSHARSRGSTPSSTSQRRWASGKACTRWLRDILFVDDLVDAFTRARAEIERLSGRAFNIGGGPRSTLSLVELVDEIERRTRRRPRLAFADWRRADQRYYVSDPSAFASATGWSPRIAVKDGIDRLSEWLTRHAESSTPELLTSLAAP